MERRKINELTEMSDFDPILFFLSDNMLKSVWEERGNRVKNQHAEVKKKCRSKFLKSLKKNQ